MIRLDPLGTRGADAIDALLDAAFGAERRGRTAYAIRRGMAWLTGLSYAAVDTGTDEMLGLLQSWPVALHAADGAQAPLVMVGPVAVLPDHQGEGVGRLLMDRLIEDVDGGRTTDPLMMIGDPEYYGRFWGFTADATAHWEAPGPVERRRLLARPSARSGLDPSLAGMLGPRRPIAIPT